MSTTQNTRHTLQDAAHGAQRKAFIFYSNWYTDACRSLTGPQLAEFVLVIIRYASEGTLPDDTTTPIVRTMFDLIRFSIDADLKKYEEMVEANRAKAEASAEKRRSIVKRVTTERLADVTTPDVDIVDSQRPQCLEPRNKNQKSKNKNQETLQEEKKEEEARGEMLAPRDEVEAFWREHRYKSSVDEFLDYYTSRHWVTARGIPLRSWKRAAVMWEDKFRRDVLPQRLREARAQATLDAEARSTQRANEAAAQRRSERAQREAEADRTARRSVSPELGKHMYRRALSLANGNDDIALDLMRRAPDDAELFKRLAEGASPPALPNREGARRR